MQLPQACPPRDDYRRLVRRELPSPDVERLCEHIASCSPCAAAVQTLLGEDTLLTATGGSPGATPTDRQAPADLARQLLALLVPSPGGPTEFRPVLAPAQGPGEVGRLAHYRVLQVLGEGGMGVVFLAEDTLLGRTVALKTMKPEVAADPRHRRRFLREARAAAKVEHDHIVPIYGVGEDRGVPWLAMPFLKGQSLDGLLKRQRVLRPAQAARLGAQVAKGLAAAHAAGLIHRDVKPANIWVEPEGGGRARLLDFGLARDSRPDRDEGEQLTRTGTVMGTPAYMAPEQARGEPVDVRADLFSLGCVLYRAVTGRLPFQGQGMMGVLLALTTETPPAPHEVNPAVPPPLSALIMSLLAKDRSARPASAAAVAVALAAFQENPAAPAPVAKPVAVPASPRQEEQNPWAGLTEVTEPEPPVVAPRRRWPLMTAAALLLALGGVLAVGIVIIIKNRGGREVPRVPVPGAGSAEIRQNGDSGKPKVEPVDPDPDRRAAQWVRSLDGGIFIRVNEEAKERFLFTSGTAPFGTVVVGTKDELPKERFLLTGVGFRGAANVTTAGLANFKGCKALKVLTLYGAGGVSDEGLAYLEDCKDLEQLTLGRTGVIDAGLAHFKGCKKLTSLNLETTGVSDAGLAHFKDCNQLTDLFLGGTRVGDAGLEHLKGLTRLQVLGLSETQVSDAGLDHLEGLTNLTRLWLNNTRVGSAGLEHLQGMTGLSVLDLRATEVGDAGLAHLKGLPNLTELWLDGTGVTDAGLVHLQRMTKLGRLELGGTRVGDAGLVHLQGLPNLGLLNLGGTRVSDAGLVHLKSLPKLGVLYLKDTRVSDKGLTNLAHLPLARIDLGNSRVSARGFASVRTAFPQAEVWGEPTPSLAEDLLAGGAKLTIRPGEGQEDRLVKKIEDLPREPFLVRRADCTGLKKPPAELLARLGQWREYEFEQLEALDLSGCAIDNLSFAPPLEGLQELNVSGTKLGDLQPVIGLKRLRKLTLDRTAVGNLGPAAELTRLEELSLAGTPVADAALQSLAELPNLRRLNVAQTGVTGRGLGYLAKLPKLAELSLAGSKVSDLLAGDVGALTKLERLSLAGCTLSDAGLKNLAGLSDLKDLDLTNTQVTAEGVAGLQKALPKCRIVWAASPEK